MNDAERMRILELLEQGKITSAEAAELLSALDDQPRESPRRERRGWGFAETPPGGARWFRVRVTDPHSGRTRANVTIPIGMVGMGIGLTRKFKMHGHPQIDAILEAVRAGRRGTVFDVLGGDGERVEIIIE
jgi:hypothetical protein